MQRIRDIVKNTITPSWIESVPYNFGDAAAGPLKADEWRTMSTIYLPLALISLWGDGTPHSSPEVAAKFRHVLDHTMALVCAIILACARTMTHERATAYRSYIASFIQDLQDLHPDTTRRTNHHMAMHIYDFLHLFGPVHSWWCFPFERLIGQLQRITSNHKFGKIFLWDPSWFIFLIFLLFLAGQLEPTLLQSFIKAGKLRRWLARPDCSPAIKECKTLFDKAYAPKVHNVGDSGEDVFVPPADEDDSIPTVQTVPSDLRPLVKGTKASLRARLQLNHVFYTTSSAHLGNSLVLFYLHSDRSEPPIPGSIKYIFLQDGQWIFAVQRQCAAQDGIVDPFKVYTDFPAQLYSSGSTNKVEAVQVDWVMCHFAWWEISSGHVVVLSLSRVCISLFTPLYVR